jgi:hypothetical protein
LQPTGNAANLTNFPASVVTTNAPDVTLGGLRLWNNGIRSTGLFGVGGIFDSGSYVLGWSDVTRYLVNTQGLYVADFADVFRVGPDNGTNIPVYLTFTNHEQRIGALESGGSGVSAPTATNIALAVVGVATQNLATVAQTVAATNGIDGAFIGSKGGLTNETDTLATVAARGASWTGGVTLATTGGRVGMGTAAPTGIVHAASSSATEIAMFERSGQSGQNLFASARFMATKTSDMTDGFGTGMGYYIQDNAGVVNLIGVVGAVRAGADNTGDLVFRPATNGVSVERVRITSTGNVLIGTTNSGTAKLDVNGDAIVRSNLTVNGSILGPDDLVATFTNTSALSMTATVGRAHVWTLTSTGTATIVIPSWSTATSEQVKVFLSMTGLPSVVFPTGCGTFQNGSFSSNAPGVAQYNSGVFLHSAQEFYALFLTNTTPMGTP